MTLDKSDLVVIRDYTPDDRNFILATFLRGLFHGGFFWNEMPKPVFMLNYHAVLDKLLPNSKIRLACDKTDPSVIYSYVITNKDETVLHWAFTKAAWRNIGLAKSLTPVSIESVSHLTNQGRSILRKYPTLIFDPFSVA